VGDLSAAREFYEDKLGLKGEETPGGWAVRGADGTVAYLLPGISDAGSASWPVASFRVENVRQTVRDLRSRGVPFLGQEELPFELDGDGISADTSGIQVAWMRDPDGSVLTVFSDTAPGQR
jgi:catechol 2,3-dioxygenase-like lactoylglutathione lyase family enzyme